MSSHYPELGAILAAVYRTVEEERGGGKRERERVVFVNVWRIFKEKEGKRRVSSKIGKMEWQLLVSI